MKESCKNCMHRPACEDSMNELPPEGCEDYEREIAGGPAILALFAGILAGLAIGGGIWAIFEKVAS